MESNQLKWKKSNIPSYHWKGQQPWRACQDFCLFYESLLDLLVMIKNFRVFSNSLGFCSSTWIITQFFKWPCKNWMPLYITVLLYEAIYMKLSSYWVTCVPFKQCRGPISSYGIQDPKVQLWNKFLSLGNTGIWFFNNNPLINTSISNSYHKQVQQKKALQTKVWEKKYQILQYYSNNFCTAVDGE